MDQKPNSLLDRYIAAQDVPGARIRVWSLVVTIFGDAIEPHGGVIRLGVLQKITARLGIENNALRTAMSRLANDGWLERERIGRASYYRPTKMASMQNAKACEIIYNGLVKDWNGRWKFALSTRAEGFAASARADIHKNDFAFYGRKLAISPELEEGLLHPQFDNAVIVSAGNFGSAEVADILANTDFHVDCRPSYSAFIFSISKILHDVSAIDELSGLDAIALRILLVHNWRRIVLKDVRWPVKARENNWPGFEAQRMMREAYHQLLEASQSWLIKQDCVPEGSLPDAGPGLKKRFLT